MIRALLVDDEELARSVVRDYLQEHSDVQVIGECSNGYEAVKLVSELKPDILFLDIQMPKLNGLEVLDLIDENPAVIFATAYDEYAIQAFEVNAIDYLLKPFSKERFNKALDAYRNGKNKGVRSTKEAINQVEYQRRIVIKDNHEIVIIPLDELFFIEAYDDYVKIHTAQKKYVKKKTLSSYEKALNPSQFVRVHRSFIINISKLHRIENYEKNSYRAILTNGERVPISRTCYPQLLAVLGL